MRSLFLIVALPVLSNSLIAQETHSEFVNIGSYSLHARIARPASINADMPTLVLEAGHGSDSRFWSAIQPILVSEFGVSAIAYDRAGTGESGVSTAPYDIRNDANDLKALLGSLDIDGRILLIAHSYGGMIAQIYASKWPESVAGIIFLDPNTAAAYIAPYRAFIENITFPEPQTRAQKTAAEAFDAIADSLITVYRDAPLPESVPIVVISSESGIFPTARENEAFKLGHQLLAKSVINGEWFVADGTNHSIIDNRTDVVIESVARLLNPTGNTVLPDEQAQH